MIRHPKIHGNESKKRPNWTILTDFRLFEKRINFDENCGNRDNQHFYFEIQFDYLSMLLGAKTTSQRIRHPKIHGHGTKKRPNFRNSHQNLSVFLIA